jgi:hypothetical protein
MLRISLLSREQVNTTDGSTIQVAKLSFQIFSTRLYVTFESDILKDSPKSSVPAPCFISPEIIRILFKQCPLINILRTVRLPPNSYNGTKRDGRRSLIAHWPPRYVRKAKVCLVAYVTW